MPKQSTILSPPCGQTFDLTALKRAAGLPEDSALVFEMPNGREVFVRSCRLGIHPADALADRPRRALILKG